MSRVSVVIPWRGGCEHRERALNHVLNRYHRTHPEWLVALTGDRAQRRGWSKGAALYPALLAAEGEIVVVADADVITDATEAVEAVRDGAAWAVPHRGVHRLTEDSTDRFIAGESWADLPLDQRPYLGVRGGGVLVAPRAVLLDIPLDPRFVGWGQEDESWGYALETLLGVPWRGQEPLIHMWHPPQARVTRSRGSVEGWRLRCRYARAIHDRDAMRSLVKEAKDAALELDLPPVRSVHRVGV